MHVVIDLYFTTGYGVFFPVLQHYRHSFTKRLAIKCFACTILIPKICFIFPGGVNTRDVLKWKSFTQGMKLKKCTPETHTRGTWNIVSIVLHAFMHRIIVRKGRFRRFIVCKLVFNWYFICFSLHCVC